VSMKLIHMMWIPSHAGVSGNQRAYQLAGDAVQKGDFLPLSRVRLLEGWQSGWDGSDIGRYAYSILPVVSFMPWFRRFDGDRAIISMINRMMADHSCPRSHLGRVGIVEGPMSVRSRDYETVDHVLWGQEKFDAERPQFWMDLRLTGTEWGTPIRDILDGRDLGGAAISFGAATLRCKQL
jgi:hypothetical protein